MSKIGQSIDISKLPEESWRPISLDNHRMGERINEREIDRIPVWMQIKGEAAWQRVRLRDYSLSGFGLFCGYADGPTTSASLNDLVTLKFILATHQEVTVPCTIQNLAITGKGQRLGLKRLNQPSPIALAGADPRNEYLINESKPLKARIENSFLFDEWAHADLIGIGPDRVLVFKSTDTSLLIIPGNQITISMDILPINFGLIKGLILWSTYDLDESSNFAMAVSDLSFESINALGEFFIQDWGCKPNDLKKCGFKVRRLKSHLGYRFLTTQQEYAQVLALRRNAYVYAGKRGPEYSPEQFSSNFDPNSRILIASHLNKIVASLTLNFGIPGTQNFRSESEFPNHKYPVDVPPKNLMIEAHSACTHKDYRGGDLILGMIENSLRTLILSDREWIITLVTAELMPLYSRLGFKKLGASIPVKSLNNIEHELILIHRNAILFAVGVKITDWTYFYSDLVTDLLEKRLIELSPWRWAYLKCLLLSAKIIKPILMKKLQKSAAKNSSINIRTIQNAE